MIASTSQHVLRRWIERVQPEADYAAAHAAIVSFSLNGTVKSEPPSWVKTDQVGQRFVFNETWPDVVLICVERNQQLKVMTVMTRADNERNKARVEAVRDRRELKRNKRASKRLREVVGRFQHRNARSFNTES